LRSLTPKPGVSMPAVTTKFDNTKHDIRNGRNTGSPVSVKQLAYSSIELNPLLQNYLDAKLNRQSSSRSIDLHSLH
jgi:hypothetical protein